VTAAATAAAALERVHARVERMNRASYLAGLLTPAQLEGLIVFLESAVEPDNRPALEQLDRDGAAAALAFMLF
jgi:hypothetical protein